VPITSRNIQTAVTLGDIWNIFG